jgi:hypothetical protein
MKTWVFVLILAGCGPGTSVPLQVVPAVAGTKLSQNDIRSVEIILVDAGSADCDTIPSPYVTFSATSLRRRVLAIEDLKIEDLPTGNAVLLLADFYGEANANGTIVGSGCVDNLEFAPNQRTTVRLLL